MDKVVSAWGLKIPLWNACALIHFSMLCEKYIECFVQQVLNIVENSSERNCSLVPIQIGAQDILYILHRAC